MASSSIQPNLSALRMMPRPPLQNCPAWARNAGLWAKAVRLSWRQLLRFDGAAPIVLLFADGGAGLLVGADPERNVVFLADPTRSGETRIAIDGLRLHQVWSGEVLLMRPERSQSAADASFSLAWLARLVLQEKALLRDIGLASLTLSFLTIFPPLVVMSAVDKVLTYRSYSTLGLLAVMLAIAAVFEAFLGYARRLIVLVVAGESTERFMRRCRRRGRFRPMRRLCGACAANPCFCGFSAR